MRSSLLAAASVAAIAAAHPAAAPAPAEDPAVVFSQAIVRGFAQYALLNLRGQVDLTWKAIDVDGRTGDVSLIGVEAFPFLDWDAAGDCSVTVDRVDLTPPNIGDDAPFKLDVYGAIVAAACLPPEAQGGLAPLGLTEVVADHATVSLRYEIASSELDATVSMSLEGLGVVEAAADFEYVWLYGLNLVDPEAGGEPTPVASLRSIEVTFENRGVMELIDPMLSSQLPPDPAALGAIIDGGLRQALSSGPQGPTPLNDAQEAFIASATEAAPRFLEEKARISIVSNPDGVVWLDFDAFDQGPAAIFDQLRPIATVAPLAAASLVDPTLIATDPAQLAAGDRVTVGRALITGVGAPRDVAGGVAALEPLVEAWDADAAAVMADGLAAVAVSQEEIAEAYAAALVAGAGGSTDGLAIAGRLEERLSVGTALDAQALVFSNWPGAREVDVEIDAAAASGSVGALREHAIRFANGSGAPRNYEMAYMLATVAAAAGDRASAALRDQIERRYAAYPTEDRAAWRAVAAGAEAEATAIWAGVLGAAVADAYR